MYVLIVVLVKEYLLSLCSVLVKLLILQYIQSIAFFLLFYCGYVDYLSCVPEIGLTIISTHLTLGES